MGKGSHESIWNWQYKQNTHGNCLYFMEHTVYVFGIDFGYNNGFALYISTPPPPQKKKKKKKKSFRPVCLFVSYRHIQIPVYR